MEIDRARAISEVSGKLIDSAKVEVELLKVTGGTTDSAFFNKKSLPAPKADKPKLVGNG